MVNIFSIYAPRNGRKSIAQKKFWKELQTIFDATNKSGVILIGIDANGQLGPANNGQRHQNTVGTWTHSTKTEQGNGIALRNFCAKKRLVPMNTWKQQQKNDNDTEYATVAAL